MTEFAGTIDDIQLSFQHSDRTGPLRMYVWHHQASKNNQATIGMMVSGSRQVSSTTVIDNKPMVGGAFQRAAITGIVPENRRPWTSSSVLIDGRALTSEVCNSSGAPDWGIADATYESCAIKAADAYRYHGIPLKRVTSIYDPTGHIGHGELLGMFNESYATFCPGNLDIDRILNRAREIVNSTLGDQLGEDDMSAAGEARLLELAGQILADVRSVSEQVKDIQGSIYFRIIDSESPGAVWISSGSFRLWIEDWPTFVRLGAPERVSEIRRYDALALKPIQPGSPRPPSYVFFENDQIVPGAIWGIYGGEVKVWLSPTEWERIRSKYAAEGVPHLQPVILPVTDPRYTLRQVELFAIENDPSGKVYSVDRTGTVHSGQVKQHITWERYMELARPVYIMVPADHPLAKLPEGSAF